MPTTKVQLTPLHISINNSYSELQNIVTYLLCLSLCQVVVTLLKIGSPWISPAGARSLNKVHRHQRHVLMIIWPQRGSSYHYTDVTMSPMASQITSLWIVYSTVYSRSKKTSQLRVIGLCAGNSPGTGEFSAQKASNAENVFIWWRQHESWPSAISSSPICRKRDGNGFTRYVCLCVCLLVTMFFRTIWQWRADATRSIFCRNMWGLCLIVQVMCYTHDVTDDITRQKKGQILKLQWVCEILAATKQL